MARVLTNEKGKVGKSSLRPRIFDHTQSSTKPKGLISQIYSIDCISLSQFNFPAHWIEILRLIAVFASQNVLAAFNNPLLKRIIPSSERSTIDIERPTGGALKCRPLAHWFTCYSCYLARIDRHLPNHNLEPVFEIVSHGRNQLLLTNSVTGRCTTSKLVQTFPDWRALSKCQKAIGATLRTT